MRICDGIPLLAGTIDQAFLEGQIDGETMELTYQWLLRFDLEFGGRML